MNIQGKIEVAKMRSLIERMEKPLTVHSAMLNEAKHILKESETTQSGAGLPTAGPSATGPGQKTRKQVSRDEFLDLLAKAEKKADDNKGQWYSMTYVNCKPVYSTKAKWRHNDVTNALKQTADLEWVDKKNKDDQGNPLKGLNKDKEWHQKLTAFNDPNVKGRGPYKSVIVVTTYMLHYKSQEKIDNAYNQEYLPKLKALRMKYAPETRVRDGVLGNNPNIRQDTGWGADIGQKNNLSKDFNMIGHRKAKTTIYLVDEQGNIGDELPEVVFKSLTAPPKQAGPEKEIAAAIGHDPALVDAYMKAKKELNQIWNSKTFTLEKILCMTTTIDHIQYYYLNDMLKTDVGKGVYANPAEMLKIGEEKVGESFKYLDDFAKGESLVSSAPKNGVVPESKEALKRDAMLLEFKINTLRLNEGNQNVINKMQQKLNWINSILKK